MGIQERKARQKEALRQQIIQAATGIFLEEGYEGTSIRKIASIVEYSPATLYLYFEDKQAIFQAILANAYEEFLTFLKPAKIIADPLSRLQEMYKKYIEFAFKYPSYYDLLYLEPATATPKEDGANYAHQTSQLFTDTIRECKKNGYFVRHDAEALALSVWSFAHGLVSLRHRHRLDNFPDKEWKIHLEQTLREFSTILRAAQ